MDTLKVMNIREKSGKARIPMIREDVMKVSGGDIFDEIGCAFDIHNYKSNCFFENWNEKGEHIRYYEYTCTACGKKKYKKHNFTTGKTVTLTKEEFDAEY